MVTWGGRKGRKWGGDTGKLDSAGWHRWEEGVLCLRGCGIREMDGHSKPRVQGNGNLGLCPQGPKDLSQGKSATSSFESSQIPTNQRDTVRFPVTPSPNDVQHPSPRPITNFSNCTVISFHTHKTVPARLITGPPKVYTQVCSPSLNPSVWLTANCSLAHSLWFSALCTSDTNICISFQNHSSNHQNTYFGTNQVSSKSHSNDRPKKRASPGLC